MSMFVVDVETVPAIIALMARSTSSASTAHAIPFSRRAFSLANGSPRRTVSTISMGRSEMPIHVKLDDMLHARRMTLTELSERVDITLANLSVLKTGKARAIRFSTLEAICEALRCQPGDILEFDTAASADVRSA